VTTQQTGSRQQEGYQPIDATFEVAGISDPYVMAHWAQITVTLDLGGHWVPRAATLGRDGNLVVLASPTLPPGDEQPSQR
jgi:hypothetical protein